MLNLIYRFQCFVPETHLSVFELQCQRFKIQKPLFSPQKSISLMFCECKCKKKNRTHSILKMARLCCFANRTENKSTCLQMEE